MYSPQFLDSSTYRKRIFFLTRDFTFEFYRLTARSFDFVDLSNLKTYPAGKSNKDVNWNKLNWTVRLKHSCHLLTKITIVISSPAKAVRSWFYSTDVWSCIFWLCYHLFPAYIILQFQVSLIESDIGLNFTRSATISCQQSYKQTSKNQHI